MLQKARVSSSCVMWKEHKENLSKRIDCINRITKYYYNERGQINALTDPAEHQTLLKYDSFGNINQI